MVIRRLDLYMIKELLVPFFIGTVAVVLMFQANLLIALFKNFQTSHIPFVAIAQVLVYKTPFFLNMTLPVGMALASSLAVSRLVRESELTAMRSVGIPILRVVAPVAFFGALVAVGNFLLVERVMPSTEKQGNKLMNEIAIMGSNVDFKSNVVITLRGYTASFGSVQRLADGSLLLNRILLIEYPRPEETWLYSADQGTYRDGLWTLQNVYVRAFKREELTVAHPRKDMVINERISIQDLFQPARPEEQTFEDLSRAIREAKRLNRDTTMLEVAYHIKFSVPAACFVFALTGPVFAVIFSRSGAFVGVLLSIVLVLLYYNAFVISTEIFGRNGWLSPVLAAWLPNILFLVVGVALLRRAE